MKRIRSEMPKSTRGRWFLGLYVTAIAWCLWCEITDASLSFFLWGLFDLTLVTIIVAKVDVIFPQKEELPPASESDQQNENTT